MNMANRLVELARKLALGVQGAKLPGNCMGRVPLIFLLCCVMGCVVYRGVFCCVMGVMGCVVYRGVLNYLHHI